METKMFEKMIAINFANLDYEISNGGVLLMGKSCDCDNCDDCDCFCSCDDCNTAYDCDCNSCDCKNT